MKTKLSFEDPASTLSSDCKKSLEVLEHIRSESAGYGSVGSFQRRHTQIKGQSKPTSDEAFFASKTKQKSTERRGGEGGGGGDKLEDLFETSVNALPAIERGTQQERRKESKNLQQEYMNTIRGVGLMPKNNLISGDVLYGPKKADINTNGKKTLIPGTGTEQEQTSPRKKKVSRTLVRVFKSQLREPKTPKTLHNGGVKKLEASDISTESPVRPPLRVDGIKQPASPLSIFNPPKAEKSTTSVVALPETKQPPKPKCDIDKKKLKKDESPIKTKMVKLNSSDLDLNKIIMKKSDDDNSDDDNDDDGDFYVTQKVPPHEEQQKLNKKYALRSLSSSNDSLCMLEDIQSKKKITKKIGFADGIGTESNPLDLDESSQHLSVPTPEEKDKEPLCKNLFTESHHETKTVNEQAKPQEQTHKLPPLPQPTKKVQSTLDIQKLSAKDATQTHPVNVLKYPENSQRCVTLTKMDLDLLRPNVYINDSIVEFYLLYLSHEVVPPSEKEDYYFFSPFFFSKLEELSIRELDMLERWTKDLYIQKRKFLIIPIHMPEHWCIAIVCLEKDVFKDLKDKQCILYFDSLGPISTRNAERKIRRWAEYETLKSTGRLEEFNAQKQKCFAREDVPFVTLDLPLQQNYTDCGLFILHYAELFIKKRPERISEFKGWFDPSETSTKRENILKLIESLKTYKSDEKCDNTKHTENKEAKDKNKTKDDTEIDRVKSSQPGEYDDDDDEEEEDNDDYKVDSNEEEEEEDEEKGEKDCGKTESKEGKESLEIVEIHSTATTQSQDVLVSETSPEST